MKISKRWIDIAGKILMILSIAFIFYKLMQYNIDLNQLMNIKIIVILFFLVLIYGLNVYVIGTRAYSTIVNIISNKLVTYSLIREIYCKSNLYKYLPGNIMHFIGRAQIAVNANIAHTDILLSTIIEIIILVIAALLIVSISIPTNVFTYIPLNIVNELIYLLIISMIMLLLILIILYIIRNKIIQIINKYALIVSKKNIRKLLISLFFCIIRLWINALIFLICLSIFIDNIPSSEYLNIIGLFVLTWVVGFLIPGAPGGIGVREAAMCLAFGYLYSDDKILYTALIYRVISIFGDMMSYIYVLVNKNIEKKFNKI